MFDSGPFVIGWFFRFYFQQLLAHKRQSRKRNRRKWKRYEFLQLPFRQVYDSSYDSDFRLSLGRKFSYHSDYVSDYDSVASENQP